MNNGVKGLIEKSGWVPVDCSLLIKDGQERTLMKANDLFKSKDTLDKDKADHLKCAISADTQ